MRVRRYLNACWDSVQRRSTLVQRTFSRFQARPPGEHRRPTPDPGVPPARQPGVTRGHPGSSSIHPRDTATRLSRTCMRQAPTRGMGAALSLDFPHTAALSVSTTAAPPSTSADAGCTQVHSRAPCTQRRAYCLQPTAHSNWPRRSSEGVGYHFRCGHFLKAVYRQLPARIYQRVYPRLPNDPWRRCPGFAAAGNNPVRPGVYQSGHPEALFLSLPYLCARP